MSHERSRLLRRLTFTFLAVAGMLLASSPAHATNSFLKTWQTTYPGCDLLNGDINCNGLYCNPPDFSDINPFVALLTGS